MLALLRILIHTPARAPSHFQPGFVCPARAIGASVVSSILVGSDSQLLREHRHCVGTSWTLRSDDIFGSLSLAAEVALRILRGSTSVQALSLVSIQPLVLRPTQQSAKGCKSGWIRTSEATLVRHTGLKVEIEHSSVQVAICRVEKRSSC